jgi:hypothetical protein
MRDSRRACSYESGLQLSVTFSSSTLAFGLGWYMVGLWP